MVSVRALAEYAENPKRYLKYRGKTLNQQAANSGIQAHDNFAKAKSGHWLLLIAVITFVAIVSFYLMD